MLPQTPPQTPQQMMPQQMMPQQIVPHMMAHAMPMPQMVAQQHMVQPVPMQQAYPQYFNHMAPANGHYMGNVYGHINSYYP